MRYEGITVSNVVRYVFVWVMYEAVLVGVYAGAFHRKALLAVARDGGNNVVLDVVVTLLGMPDIVVVALLGGVVSAGAATGAFFDYPKPNAIDLIGPGAPSGTIRVIALISVGFRVLFWAGAARSSGRCSISSKSTRAHCRMNRYDPVPSSTPLAHIRMQSWDCSSVGWRAQSLGRSGDPRPLAATAAPAVTAATAANR